MVNDTGKVRLKRLGIEWGFSAMDIQTGKSLHYEWKIEPILTTAFMQSCGRLYRYWRNRMSSIAARGLSYEGLALIACA